MDSFSRSCGRTSRRERRVSRVLPAIPGAATLVCLTMFGTPSIISGLGPAPAAAQSQTTDARASARAAMANSDWRAAIDAWTSVLALDPNDAEAKAGLRQAQAMLDQASTIDEVQDDFTLRRERLVVQFNDDVARANAAYDEGDYRQARESAVTARLRPKRPARKLAPPPKRSVARSGPSVTARSTRACSGFASSRSSSSTTRPCRSSTPCSSSIPTTPPPSRCGT